MPFARNCVAQRRKVKKLQVAADSSERSMFAGLARNILITGGAYTIISAIGLILAPLLIAQYALSGYGLILLARIVLPTATFGFLDLGLGENTTRIVATARADDDWHRAGQGIALQIALAVSVGFATAGVVYLASEPLPRWFAIANEYQNGFTMVMQITAALLPLLFLSLVAEGVLKGFEQFGKQRICEILSALTYAGMTCWILLRDFGPNAVSLALLVGLTMRMLLASVLAIFELRRAKMRLFLWSQAVRRDLLAWSGTMFFNKVLGTAQSQIAAPLLGLLVGPAAVGLFDAIVRIPRFVKQVFSLLSTVVLPVAARLKVTDVRDGTSQSSRLGTVGIAVAAGLCIPVAFAGATYSETILRLWFNEEIAADWIWHSIMFAVPVMTVLISVGGTILLADKAAFSRLNRIAFVQVCLQLALSLALLQWFNPFSFVLGQVASMALVLPLQIRLAAQVLNLRAHLLLRVLGMMALTALLAVAVKLVAPTPDFFGLIVCIAVITLVGCTLVPFLMLEKEERDRLFFTIRELVSKQQWTARQ